VRAALAAIASDEARHARLSWSVAAWARTRLGPRPAARLRHALRAAAHALDDELGAEADPRLVEPASPPAPRRLGAC
jgi:hypothetical protein